MENGNTASIVLAAGRGSRMKSFQGNKTLLPLVPDASPFKGREPVLLHVLHSLPAGAKAVVVHHDEGAVMDATRGLDLTYCRQPVLNGTGGALLATRDFLKNLRAESVIVTMGDIPLVRPETYVRLVRELRKVPMAVLGFRPEDRKQYGILEVRGDRVTRIIEWKYWRGLPEKSLAFLRICNSGIYAVRKETLLHYLSRLASSPHRVQKEIGGKWIQVEEYFITDMVEFMDNDGVPVGYIQVEDEWEVMGVDDLPALQKAQQIYRARFL